MKTPLLLLHGFTGAPASYDAVRGLLRDDFDVLCPALSGHAGQGFAGVASFDDELSRLHALIARAEGVVLCGYSLGARLGLGLLAKEPARFARATLIGVHPGLDQPAERAERRAGDARWAAVLREQGLAAFIQRWTAQPLFASQGRLSAELLGNQQALRQAQDAEGLALALERFGLGDMPCYWPHLPGLKTPLTLAAGELDAKFMDIARKAAGELPNARLLIAPSAGHNLLLERPDLVARTISPGTTAMTDITWNKSEGYEDILYEKAAEGIAKITINRPQVRNAFRPQTVTEMMRAFADAREDPEVGVVILTGAGKDAFCAGGDQKVRGNAGYVGSDGVPRLNVLDLQRQIRTLPKPVVAMVAGYAIGGGHVLHLVCDLTIAADNARFGQTGPKVGSFDGGFGASYMARIVGQKKAREIWFLCRQYDAKQALEMGLVNAVVPYEQLEAETVQWCREMLQNSPLALRCLKSALNADCDGQAGLQELAGNATLLFYMTEEGREGRDAFVQKRKPNFKKFKRLP